MLAYILIHLVVMRLSLFNMFALGVGSDKIIHLLIRPRALYFHTEVISFHSSIIVKRDNIVWFFIFYDSMYSYPAYIFIRSLPWFYNKCFYRGLLMMKLPDKHKSQQQGLKSKHILTVLWTNSTSIRIHSSFPIHNLRPT